MVTHASWQSVLIHGVENDASAGIDLGLPLVHMLAYCLLAEKHLLCICL